MTRGPFANYDCAPPQHQQQHRPFESAPSFAPPQLQQQQQLQKQKQKQQQQQQTKPKPKLKSPVKALLPSPLGLITTSVSVAPTTAPATAPPISGSPWWSPTTTTSPATTSNKNAAMADSNPFDPSRPTIGPNPNDTYFSIFNDTMNSICPMTDQAPAVTTTPGSALPSMPEGQCNYVDLTPGANGAKCGCRRFYRSNTVKPDSTEFCMCMHHACFHDHTANAQPQQGFTPVMDTPTAYLPMLSPSEPPKQAAKPSRPPHTPLQDISDRFSATVMPPAYSDFSPRPTPHATAIPPAPTSVPTSASRPHGFAPTSTPMKPQTQLHQQQQTQPQLQPQPTPLKQKLSLLAPAGPSPFTNALFNNVLNTEMADVSIPDTQSWGGSVFPQPFSQTESVNTIMGPPPPPSSQHSATTTTSSRYLLPFGGKGTSLMKRMSLKVRRPLQDCTEAIQAAIKQNDQEQKRGRSKSVSEATACSAAEDAVHFSAPTGEAFKGMEDTVNNHEGRLDRLENASMISCSHDECNERYDLADVRICDLETRMEDVEKLVNDNSFRHGNEASSVISDGYDRSELVGQIQALQAQVTQLQYSLPSMAHPWEVEVVFLPFALRKVWLPRHEFKAESSASSVNDEWTQNLPITYSTSMKRVESPFCGDWSENSDEEPQEWLLPRAYRPDNIIDHRLRSRGCIRKITVTAPDARSVQMAINTAFSSVLQPISARRQHRAPPGRGSKYLGLQQDWVPLRKIHKDSRLRFLAPAEMTTPALWDVKFLNSVLMKSTQPRLYITHPEAYVQDRTAFETGWTWQRLRELSRVYPEDCDSQEVLEADAMEECWMQNDLLDESPADASKRSRRPTPVSLSSQQQLFSRPATSRHSTPMSSRAQTPLKVVKSSARASHSRSTSSMPAPFALQNSSSPISVDSRRRIMSHDKPLSPGAMSNFVRRRTTRSPSNRAHPTPRWSTGSPSPVPGSHGGAAAMPIPMTMGLVRAASTGSSRSRYAYATPHSNAPLSRSHDESDDAAVDTDVFMTEDDVSAQDVSDSFVQISLRHSFLEHQQLRQQLLESSGESVHESSGSGSGSGGVSGSGSGGSWNPHNPEDEPWPGIEDREDSENIDPRTGSRSASSASRRSRSSDESSSQPSEYPSTHPGHGHGDFHIHEDADEDMIS